MNRTMAATRTTTTVRSPMSHETRTLTRSGATRPNARATAVIVIAIAAFAVYRAWQAFAGSPITWTDTADYARSAVWAGTRPPLVPMVLGLAGTPTRFVAIQVAVAIVSWTALAWMVGALVARRWRLVAITVVLAFASTTAVVRWDRSVLSESLSMSTVALILAALLWATSGPSSWPRVVALITAGALFASIRDTQLWVVWLLAMVVGVEAVVNGRGKRGMAAALGLALCAGVMLGGSLDAERTTVNIEHVYFVRVFPYADRVEWFAAHGMPASPALREAAKAVDAGLDVAPVVGLDPNDPRTRALTGWLHEHGPAIYARWLVTHPWYVLTEPLRDPERAYNFANGDISLYSGPGRTELTPVDELLFPPAVILAAVAVIALAVGIRTELRRRAWWWFVVAFGVLGAAHMLLAWHGDGMETTRHASVGNVQLRLAIVVLAVVAVGRLVGAREAPEAAATNQRR